MSNRCDLARGWLLKARSDLKACSLTLEAAGPYDATCFHAQQAIEKSLKAQYGPKLRQKEQELARRLGQEVKLDPMQDPEFVAFFKQNVGKLKEQYQQALDNAKEDLKAMIG